MAVEAVSLVASLVLLAVSGDQFVIGAARLAASLRVRPTVVGALIGGLGASLPELIVSGVASARGDSQLAVGNLVGSNIANVSLALAAAALIAPVRVDSKTVRREFPVCVVATLLFALLLIGGLSRSEGVTLLVVLAFAIAALLVNARRSPRRDELGLEVDEFFEGPRHGPRTEFFRMLFGLAFMVGGSEVLVRSASGLAERIGVGEVFIGLTVVAVGTSAPLIAIAIQAARRGDHDLVVGNVLGSNLFIALAGGSIVAFLSKGSASRLDLVSVWFMVGIMVAAWGFTARGSRLARWEAALLMVGYGAALVLSPH